MVFRTAILMAIPMSLNLPGPGKYKIDGIDTWDMTITSLGSASPGKFSFTAPKPNYLLRLSVYEPGEKIRPQVKATASPIEGIAPLKVQFSDSTDLQCKWQFGDASSSSEKNPVHTYKEPGLYTAILTVTAQDGLSSSMPLGIAVDRTAGTPIVRAGFERGESSGIQLHGKIRRGNDGSYDFGDGKPWKWLSVGDGPIKALEGLQSFTILGWANPTSLNIGSGGNRISFNLKYNRSGFDLVHLKDGRLRLAVNEWPDRIKNDSSPKKLQTNKWTFFAVTYDATKSQNIVHWYFGNENTPAKLDQTTNYNNGPTGQGSNDLAIGNFNKTLQGAGLDRQFRGQIRALQIHASRLPQRGALNLDAIRELQKMQ